LSGVRGVGFESPSGRHLISTPCETFGGIGRLHIGVYEQTPSRERLPAPRTGPRSSRRGRCWRSSTTGWRSCPHRSLRRHGGCG